MPSAGAPFAGEAHFCSACSNCLVAGTSVGAQAVCSRYLDMHAPCEVPNMSEQHSPQMDVISCIRPGLGTPGQQLLGVT